MKKTLCIATIMFLSTSAFADPDRVETPNASAQRVEMSFGTSLHDLYTSGTSSYASALPIPMPSAEMRVSFPNAFAASGVGVRGTWVVPTFANPSTVMVDAFYSFGFRPKRLRGVTPALTIDVGPSVAIVGGLGGTWSSHAYAEHVDVGGVASVSAGAYFGNFLARITGGYRAGVSTCTACGVQWDGDAFASLDIGFALDVAPGH